jgi:hypothetical protein
MIINLDETQLDRIADLVIHDSVAASLEKIMRQVAK